jgi:hypothetical protein
MRARFSRRGRGHVLEVVGDVVGQPCEGMAVGGCEPDRLQDVSHADCRKPLKNSFLAG